jgi:hypothetical protein
MRSVVVLLSTDFDEAEECRVDDVLIEEDLEFDNADSSESMSTPWERKYSLFS